jgi:hypothetical protein
LAVERLRAMVGRLGVEAWGPNSENLKFEI